MTAICTLNYADRGVLTLLLEPIKNDLQLSDSELGFVAGIAFAFFYAILGLPIARWADRGDRVTIASLAIGLWGVTVMATMLVASFPQLVCARVAAAVGEAGAMPPTYAMVGDFFPRGSDRTKAMGIYMLASPASSLISFGLGGLLYAHYGWRTTFLLMGLPGLILALLTRSSLRDPRRLQYQGTDSQERMPLRAVLALLWHQQSCRNLMLSVILLLTLGQGLGPWYAAFMVRTHGLSPDALGLWFGLIFGIGGAAGILLGSQLLVRLYPDQEGAQMRFCAIVVGALVPVYGIFLTVSESWAALLALVPVAVLFNAILAPTFAIFQRLVPPQMRATSFAVLMLVANLISLGGGPQLVGIMSDLLQPQMGKDSLRYAMLVMTFAGLWSAVHYWRLSKHVETDIRRREIIEQR